MWMNGTYSCAGHNKLNLASRGANEFLELLDHPRKNAQAVVVGKDLEEVPDRLAPTRGVLRELGDNGRLVLGRQGWCREDGGQLRILC